jgi:hypothetical protein
MSHYPVFVIGNDPRGALAPFDENIEVAPYPSGLDWEEELAKAREFYGGQGKAGPAANEPEPSDLTYLQDWNGGGWEPRPGGGYQHITRYNPASKWDWYAVGGRWPGQLVLQGSGKGVDECEIGDLDVDATLKNTLPHAVLTAEGRWLEQGRMGWFGVVLEPVEAEDWEADVRKALAAVADPATRITCIDCHI